MKKKIIQEKLCICIPILIIMIISFFNMYNAKLLSPNYSNHLIKQIIWYFIGFVFFFIAKKIPIKKLFKYSFIFYILSIILLILVLIFGQEINGAKAWFTFKYFSLQPSEITKLSLALFLSQFIATSSISKKSDELKILLKIFITTFIPSILIFLEPDTGAIIIYLLISTSILLASKISKKWFIPLMIIGCIFLILFFYFYFTNQEILIKLLGTSFFYRVERLLSFTQGDSLQLENALVAIGSSSWLGSGLGHVSIYIPEAPTDFIVAFTISNFGYLSIIVILLCYFIIDILLIKEFFKTQGYKKFFIISFISMFFFQQFENILMNIGLMPIIGIPLPFLSYGGTTILIYFIFLGIILNTNKKESK